MAGTGLVTELVEMQLLGLWQDFFPTFEATFLPVLLAAPGILSVRTGPKYASHSCHEDVHAAISITQWTSLQAHEDFLNGPSAKSFFDGLGRWMAGPPKVGHFELGSLRGHGNSSWLALSRSGLSNKSSKPSDTAGVEATFSARCVENDGIMLQLFVCSTENAMRNVVQSAYGSGEVFGMQVRSLGFPSTPRSRGKL
ncbi:hypothetical protein BAUCODRAFT_149159 [Baudoinia panamericana UAMH 10762]|uniref:ABM domain-containing protein n=1 Tax=Baudoinia panamericana (strain UAMH 10762) TaxID=717646 RepID=M2MEW4_BAUPA|nr:uncharacterized protein BAUCODRAFT_149159 [Baudoinia panamericana UAMH 10762]EMC95136.1 hypothetical protein BAUCODRAFT_149159 [Baudoinia panamericana UAMH 10762]